MLPLHSSTHIQFQSRAWTTLKSAFSVVHLVLAHASSGVVCLHFTFQANPLFFVRLNQGIIFLQPASEVAHIALQCCERLLTSRVSGSRRD
jgi:hypothetical protein